MNRLIKQSENMLKEAEKLTAKSSEAEATSVMDSVRNSVSDIHNIGEHITKKMSPKINHGEAELADGSFDDVVKDFSEVNKLLLEVVAKMVKVIKVI